MKSAFRRIIASMFERQVARLVARHSLRVVAVAGSVGKTSTKTAIATVLSQKYRTLVQDGNYNSEIGLPLSVFGMEVPGLLINPFAWVARLIRAERQVRGDYPYEVLVLELGTDHPGEIGRYLRYLKPDIGVVTAVTPEHMENFPGGIDEVAAEELRMAAGSKFIVAGYDEISASHRHKYIDHHPHGYYAIGKHQDYGFVVDHADPVEGTTGTLTKSGHATVVGQTIGMFGDHIVKAAVAAYAVGDLMGLSSHQLELGLAKVRPVAGRMNPLAATNGAIILDDTYNSSPEAVFAALNALAGAKISSRRIGILGSMNELGPDSPKYHKEVGEAAASLDMLVTVGKLANEYLGPAAVRAGLDPTRFKPADSPRAAGQFLKLVLRPGDLVLAKGSQNGVFAEEAVKILLADPADAEKLVRQSPAWMRTKRAQFNDLP